MRDWIGGGGGGGGGEDDDEEVEWGKGREGR